MNKKNNITSYLLRGRNWDICIYLYIYIYIYIYIFFFFFFSKIRLKKIVVHEGIITIKYEVPCISYNIGIISND